MLQSRPLIAVAAVITMLIPSTPTEATFTPASVTRGSFVTLPGGTGLGYEVTGHAVMIRTANDRTIVVVTAAGLDPRTTYPVHVHNAPCDAPNPGGGHYQDVVGGPVDDVNEMWPAITTNRGGRGLGVAFHGARARPEAQAIVVHHHDTPSIRLACLDLD